MFLPRNINDLPFRAKEGTDVRARKQEKWPTFDVRLILLEITGQDIGTIPKPRCPYPAHGDRNASASVDHERGLFKCFACEKEGDGISLLCDEYGISRLEALERAKLICGTEPSGSTSRSTGGKRRRASDLLRGDR